MTPPAGSENLLKSRHPSSGRKITVTAGRYTGLFMVHQPLTPSRSVVIGTRKSPLALHQTAQVKATLEQLVPGLHVDVKHITTQGDRSQSRDEPLPSIGGKGLFTAELEQALLDTSIDLAVHSLKDLPTKLDPRFTIGAVCRRESPADVLISRNGERLMELPRGAVIGTSSVRRESQIRNLRPDLEIATIRGNVDSRISKLRNPALRFSAIVLAQAGLDRLGRGEEITQIFEFTEMVPAPGQGALGVQCRAGDQELLHVLKLLDHPETRAETNVERTFLAMLDAGCNTPIGCIARCVDGRIQAFARCISRDGGRILEVNIQGDLDESVQLGRALGEEAIQRGVRNIDL